MRTFTDSDATRERVPLLLALYGPSGGGKTFSALRVATGISKVAGGEIFVIDTEARRALHYADRFKFRHVPFAAPYGPMDYLAAIEHCVERGAKTIVIDSMSHEHEGPGGVLEIHADEMVRLSRGDEARAEKVKMLAWVKPKQERRRLLNTLSQLEANFILCFRAREKLKIERGKDPEPLGWMPIGGEEYVYEMTMRALLPPAADGVAQWSVSLPGEEVAVKLPEQFRSLCSQPRQFDEAMGEEMARWAAGEPAVPADAPRVSVKLEWSGRETWGGATLVEVPTDELEAYHDAVVRASEIASQELAERMRAHADAILGEIKARQ